MVAPAVIVTMSVFSAAGVAATLASVFWFIVRFLGAIAGGYGFIFDGSERQEVSQ